MEVLVKVAQMLLGLSILVGIHELGHLLAAKAFGMRAEKFFIGFPPKVFSFKWGETEYGLGSIPLGGFVKISGMIDESMDMKQMESEPQPWEFRSKPAWQRLIVMLGGIIMNVITGIVVFTMLVYINGEKYYSVDEVNKYGIYASEFAEDLGFRDGDKIIAVNGITIENFADVLNPNYILEQNSYYTVLRDGKELKIPLPPDFMEQFSEQKDFISLRAPFKVKRVRQGSNAMKAGLEDGDKIVGINGVPVEYFREFRDSLISNTGKGITLKVIHEGTTEPVTLNAQVGDDGLLGFEPEWLLNPSVNTFTLGQSIPKGTREAFDVILIQLKAFNKIFKGEVSATKSISGPIGIANIFSGTWDWVQFWKITGMLSMVLAFMNLLPIPALDGGHVVFLTYEIVTGHKPSQRFLTGAQQVGMVLLLALMVFAFGNDIYRIFAN
ncbi:RIP metalloprotease RseP [Limibacter armeniacum]|uniref:RIP metalloprotease RseP n=1 Tax=Limibacter armeniacum TaxID=466084 RepID=UPI002FE608BB